MSWKRVVAITGCDSGLGWAMAARSAREGIITVAVWRNEQKTRAVAHMVLKIAFAKLRHKDKKPHVIAITPAPVPFHWNTAMQHYCFAAEIGMYNGTETEAACALKKLCAHPYQLDVTDTNSITKFKKHVMTLLKDNPSYKLYALVNNAGVMTIGNYEWQTPQMIENTINVNLLGAMRMISAFLPKLREDAIESRSQGTAKPRIINVSSHCGLHPLPGFGPYSASKAGLLALTQSLRLENRDFGLPAIAFLPGGFIGSSNLMSNQLNYGQTMLEHLTEEQRTIHGDNIRNLSNYLQQASVSVNFDSVKDENIIETFIKALNDEQPKMMYKVENWRYKFYYNLFKLPLNETAKSWLIKRFLSFP